MSQIKVLPLGAGQDVGRSCIIVSIGGKNVMFDCGMHMGYNDERRFPNFKYFTPEENFDQLIDCVIISHFHLDHCGALPHFTEICGYSGPIIMTYPTKAVCPILLEDFRKITVERKGETNFFTSAMIKDCMKKVTAVNIHQTIMIDDQLEVQAFYAGHVLGAAMFLVRVGSQSCLYTGDYNMTPDRHLGSAQIHRLRVDLLITEATYATTIRDSKRLRERDFLKKVHDTIKRGGKVLIPVFALGRAQELCILIETYWEQMNLGHVPVYFSAGLVEKANLYYKLFINWTNEKIKDTFFKHNMFDFKHIKPFDRAYADKSGPMVLFATPGMLHAGMSLEVFKKWCGNELNTCILPGYCVAGTVGNKILSGAKRIEIDKKQKVDVNMQVCSMSFSAHADAKGIMQLIQQCQPKNVMLVHGEKGKMQFLKEQIKKEFAIKCYDPANGELLTLNTLPSVSIDLSRALLLPSHDHSSLVSRAKEKYQDHEDDIAEMAIKKIRMDQQREIEGILVIDWHKPSGGMPSLKLLHPQEVQHVLNLESHHLLFDMQRHVPDGEVIKKFWMALLKLGPASHFVKYQDQSENVQIKSIQITYDSRLNPNVRFTWSHQEEEMATSLINLLDMMCQSRESIKT